MAHDLLGAVDSYIAGWNAKDIEAIAKTVSDDVHFVGPNAESDGKDAFLASIIRMLPVFKKTVVRSRFSSGNEVMLAFDFVCAEPIWTVRTAELLTFRNGLICKSEIFFDTRPFERMKAGASE